jgi:hypothetical protein
MIAKQFRRTWLRRRAFLEWAVLSLLLSALAIGADVILSELDDRDRKSGR